MGIRGIDPFQYLVPSPGGLMSLESVRREIRDREEEEEQNRWRGRKQHVTFRETGVSSRVIAAHAAPYFTEAMAQHYGAGSKAENRKHPGWTGVPDGPFYPYCSCS